MALPLDDYRGTRRNLPFTRALIGGVMGGAFAVGVTLGLGLWTSLHSGQEAIGLMSVQTADARALVDTTIADEAPSRMNPVVTVVTPPLRGAVEASVPVVHEEVVMFNGRPLRRVGNVDMKTTAYSPDARSCGKWADGFTASGYSVYTNGGKLVAADTDLLPFGSLVSIPGYHDGKPVPVLDRGGAIKGHRLDLLYPTHEIALQWGVQDLEVTVWEYAD